MPKRVPFETAVALRTMLRSLERRVPNHTLVRLGRLCADPNYLTDGGLELLAQRFGAALDDANTLDDLYIEFLFAVENTLEELPPCTALVVAAPPPSVPARLPNQYARAPEAHLGYTRTRVNETR